MKKNFIILFLSLLFCDTAFSESYHFKQCKISNAVMGNYIINVEKNVIEVELKTIDGNVQNFSDKIKLIEENKIVSEKIKSARGEKLYYQYFLNAKNKSVTKLQFKKETGADISVFNLFEKRESFCKDVKSNWIKKKIDATKAKKEEKEILKAQEKLKKEQSELIKCQGDSYQQWTNCKGRFKANTGYIYIGLFLDGKIVKGTSIYPDGSKYVGEFRDFKPQGYGVFVWANGDKYLGEWKTGKNNGNGTKIWKDGRQYMGYFKNDKFHGEGTLLYPDGKKYAGGFINGKRHGEGTISYPDGSAYIGVFKAGVAQGLGECVSKDNSSLPCQSETDTQSKNFSGKDTHNISIVARKWVRVSQYEANSKKGKKIMDKLEADFKSEALKLCASKGNYNILDKKMEVLEVDETPAYGLETKLKIGINGVIECK